MKMKRTGRKHLIRAALVGALVAATAVSQAASPSSATTGKRPNIVIILGDDLGFSDMGAFGGEIRTPNLDSLAQDGVRFTQFYTNASCSPTRSMLLSGVDTHLNGLGNMDEWAAPNQWGVDGYEGYLNNRVATLPQVLKDAGYHTYMVGKWHMGKKPDQIPAARGFERDFSLLDGAGSYWDMWNFTAASPSSTFTEDGRYLKKLPKDYYATKTYTDKIISFIEEGRKDGKPFFAYVSHQAPHDPYHLPRDWRNRHVGEYDKGWDVVRQERLKRQMELGIVPAGTQLAERMWFIPDATLLAPAARAIMGKKMELYAGMVENMDYHVGRLIDYLKEIGEYDNTIFIVFGDNGAEGADLFKMIAGTPGTRNFLFASMQWSQTHPNAWGDPHTYVGYGPMWAQVSMTPFSQYKGLMCRGRHPQRADRQRPDCQTDSRAASTAASCTWRTSCPRCSKWPAPSYPKTVNGQEPPPLMGKSWVKMLAGEAESPRSAQDYMAWEIFGNRAVRQGDWKLRVAIQAVRHGAMGVVQPGRRIRRNAMIWPRRNPRRSRTLLALWDDYVRANNVILPSRVMWEGQAKQLPDRYPVVDGYPPLIYSISSSLPPT